MAFALLLGLLGACGGPTFEPPDQPPHDVREGGHLHAARFEDPFSCGDPADPNARRGVPCPTERPEDARLSCDASGCHGGFRFGATTSTTVRELFGSEGPSCYTCHGEKWKD